jgi:glycosyl transferase family 25
MITIQCISLADQLDRRQYMRAQLDRCGMPYRFFDAVRIDLANGWPESYARQRRLDHSCIDMRTGEIGCYLSHRQVWMDFLASDEKLCLVIEDDVTLHADFSRVVATLCEKSADWEFVRLFAIIEKPSWPAQRITDEYTLVDYLAQPNGTQGYLLNRCAAERLIDYTASMWQAIDMAIDCEWDHGVAIQGIKPYVLDHPEIFQTTLGPGGRPRLSLHRKLMRELNRARHNMRKQRYLRSKRRRLESRTNATLSHSKDEP